MQEGLESRTVALPSGLRLRLVTNQHTPGDLAVLFVHGWPSLSSSWRHQLRACPVFAVAPDLPGVGGSDLPDDPSCWSQRRLVDTMLQLLTALGGRRWVVVGHDWGGVIAWSVALSQDPRVVAVASLCTPLYPYVSGNAVERMQAAPGAFDYQLYFMEQGGRVAAAELDRDKERTFSIVLRGADEPAGALGSSGNVRMRGGLLEGLPAHVVPGKLFAEPGVLREYVRGYERGFWGSLQLYNNYQDNTAFRGETRNVALRIPCLMVTAGRDPILKPSHSAHMEKLIPHLTRAHVPGSSHWIMEEYPQEVNAALAAFYAPLQSPRANM